MNNLTKQKQMQKWLESNNFCIVPFIHMDIETNGDYKPCCRANPLTDENGKPLNIKDYTIKEIWDHPAREKLLESFKNNEKHPACDGCWRDPSPKAQHRVKFSTTKNSLDKTIKAYEENNFDPELQWLELRPGNVCNLKCRICYPFASSQWGKDYHAIMGEGDFKGSEWWQYNVDCQWIEDPNIWSSIESLEKLKVLHFLGGEPLMVPQHFNLLQKLIDAGVSKNIEINYSTNGTKFFTQEQLDILKQFGTIKITISIDDIEKRFEYQRKNAVWKEVKENIFKFFELQKDKKFHIVIGQAISILNVYHIDEFYNTLESYGVTNNSIEVDHWVSTYGLDIRALTKKEKTKVLEKLKQGTNFRTQAVIDRMMSIDMWTPQQQQHRFLRIQRLDDIRNEKFSDVYPEMSKIISLAEQVE